MIVYYINNIRNSSYTVFQFILHLHVVIHDPTISKKFNTFENI